MLQILEAVISQVTRAHAVRQVMSHQLAGCCREQYLVTISGTHNACGVVYVQSYVPLLKSVTLLSKIQLSTQSQENSPGL